MQDRRIVPINQEVGIITPPQIVLEQAGLAAKALQDVISKKPNPVLMNDEQYLEFDDWQLCGQFYKYTVKTGDTVPVEIDGVKGAKAHADLVDIETGQIVGGAEAYCMRDEEHWNTRPKYEWQGEGKDRKRVKIGDETVPWFQLASMAQTRAGAKALRNRLAWVVVLAGYKPTPAEEMTEGTASPAVKERRTVDKSTHFCAVHNVNFFKKGGMPGYAHPIEGTDKWCNEAKQQQTGKPPEPSVNAPERKIEPPNGQTGGTLPQEAVDRQTIDLSTLEFKNAGEFKAACVEHFDMTPSDIDKETAIYDLSKPNQRKQAWAQILAGRTNA